jgi:hypothetical protein
MSTSRALAVLATFVVVCLLAWALLLSPVVLLWWVAS